MTNTTNKGQQQQQQQQGNVQHTTLEHCTSEQTTNH